jgi:ribosomal protein L37AE/L43A
MKAFCAECGVRLILKRDEAGVWTPLRCVSHPWAKRMPDGYIKRQFERLREAARVIDAESLRRVA